MKSVFTNRRWVRLGSVHQLLPAFLTRHVDRDLAPAQRMSRATTTEMYSGALQLIDVG